MQNPKISRSFPNSMSQWDKFSAGSKLEKVKISEWSGKYEILLFPRTSCSVWICQAFCKYADELETQYPIPTDSINILKIPRILLRLFLLLHSTDGEELQANFFSDMQSSLKISDFLFFSDKT